MELMAFWEQSHTLSFCTQLTDLLTDRQYEAELIPLFYADTREEITQRVNFCQVLTTNYNSIKSKLKAFVI
jgi:hypothetical protein